jgi:hypothetical protein
MHPKLLAVVGLAAALLLTTTDAFAETVANPGASTAVREYQGIIVFSQFDGSYDPASGQYRLAIRRPGSATRELLPVAPSDRPFDADIGPDSNGRPQLIYTRCGETCDLFVYSLANQTGERAVRNANDPEHNDVNPTLWRGRIAWARIYGEQIDRKVVVYTKKLTAPRSQPSTRLPGVPERRCGDVETAICGPTNGRSVDALELWGDNLAQVVGYQCRGCSGTSQTELRLVRVSDRNARPIAFQVVGLGGQQLIGPSFANGWLSWYRACLGDPEGCRGGRAQPFRHNLRSRRYAKGASGPVRVDGFADTMTYHYRVESCSPETNEPQFNANCRIEQVPSPAYEPTTQPER